MTDKGPTGDVLVEQLAALANPVRLRVLAALTDGREYVSELARQLGISRPLLHMHLQRLEAAGLVIGHLELSDDGKAKKYFTVADFDLRIDPRHIRAAVKTLTAGTEQGGPNR